MKSASRSTSATSATEVSQEVDLPNRACHVDMVAGVSPSASMLTDSNCVSVELNRLATAAKKAPWVGHVELQPVNISCTAVILPATTPANDTLRPSAAVSLSGGAGS